MKEVFAILAMSAAVIGFALWARSTEGPHRGPDMAKAWSAKFHADGPIDCVNSRGRLYQCTVTKDGQPIAIECWDDGCALQRCDR